jgi:hypothetical protein
MAKPHEPLENYDLRDNHPWVQSDYDDRADRSANIWQLLKMMQESLVMYQSTFEIQKAWEPWQLFFPYARYLDANDIVINRTTNSLYTVEEVLDLVYNIKENSISFQDKESYDLKAYEEWSYAGQKVTLAGAVPPAETDRLEIREKTVNINGNRLVSNLIGLTAAYPNQQQDADPWVDLVTYHIRSRQPAGRGGGKFQGNRELRPLPRARYIDNQEPTKVYEVYGQLFESLIQFDVWAKTATEADQLTAYFEEFVRKYTWVWKLNGVSHMSYEKQFRDEEITKWRNDITNRTIQYYVRTEYLETKQQQRLTDIRSGIYGSVVASGVYGWTLPRHVTVCGESTPHEIPFHYLVT